MTHSQKPHQAVTPRDQSRDQGRSEAPNTGRPQERPSESEGMSVRRRAPDATAPMVPSEHQAFRFRY
jgi:hypothetical protein